ncbi:hypothetical protein ACA910_017067 [Epithemia clementina (nom. ined.)]
MKLSSSAASVVAIATLAHPAVGFTPASSRSVGVGSFVGTPLVPVVVSSRIPSTALQMNLFDRFFRVARSNFNLVLSNLEQPEKILDQAVLDMQNDMVKIRQTYAELSATQRRLQEQKNQHETAAREWYERAQLALQRNKEDLARQALTRRQIALEDARSVQQQLDTNGVALDKLYQSLQLLDQKILDARSKKNQMIARARTAKTTMQVNDMLSGVTGKTSMDAFKRMEQKVEALEAAAEASAEMGFLSSSLPEANLEREFLQLEAMDAVEKELRQLKGIVQDEKQDMNQYQKILQPSTIGRDDNAVERELQAMKQQSVQKIPIRWE